MDAAGGAPSLTPKSKRKGESLRAKQISQLAALAEPERMGALAEGMSLAHDNALRIWSGSQALSRGNNVRASAILQNVAEEEAAKFLMLLDAARCSPQKLRQHLNRFYDHLARGIYARACSWRSNTYGDHLALVARQRQEYYLDGPNDVDWIFRNPIRAEREEALYVDYVQTEDGYGWSSPRADDFENLWPELEMPSAAIDLIEGLHRAGYTSARALSIVAKSWRDVELPATLDHWNVERLMLRELNEFSSCGVVALQEPAFLNALVCQYTWPLHLADLSLIRVDPDELEAQRERYYPA